MPLVVTPGAVYRLVSGRFAVVTRVNGQLVSTRLVADLHDPLADGQAEEADFDEAFLTSRATRLPGSPEHPANRPV